MDGESLKALLEKVRDGEVSASDAAQRLKFMPFSELDEARVDHHRELRCGIAEAVYGPGKTPDQAAAIACELAQHTVGPVFVTRASAGQFEAVSRVMPQARFHPQAGLIVCRQGASELTGTVAVVSAGTADLPVAVEAAEVAAGLGARVERLSDVGVAGIHRLLSEQEALNRADVVIAVAGMEGALPGIVAGLISAPVIAVPTSTGYGTGAGGLAALMTMLNSCAPGMAVVNIDNCFGASVFDATILLGRDRASKKRGQAPA